MFYALRKLFWPKLEPMNRILISKKHILHNYKYLQSLRENAKIFPVLKSNAYGHGLVEVTKIMNHTNAEYLVIDSLPEYFQVRKYTKKKFLLLGETLPHNYKKLKAKRVTFVVYNFLTLEYLLSYRKKFTVHFFLNTGMNREGFDIDDLKKSLNFLKKHDKKGRIKIEGVMSHLATADESNPNVMHDQVEMFKKFYDIILEYGHTPQYRHIGNSAGLLTLESDFFDAWRTGLSLYGYCPLDKDHPKFSLGKSLKPALDIWTKVVSVHKLNVGGGVSYNFSRGAIKNTEVAVLPFGYHEGLFRNTSNKISFGNHKQYFKQVGNICMNMSCCESTGGLKVGGNVQLISSYKKDKNKLEALAKQSGTIVYECLTRLDSKLRRELV